jgi:hypothetical protein
MRLTVAAFAIALLAAPALAGDIGAEELFGYDPGNKPAHACFSKTFNAAWLKAHPDQNIEKLTVYVGRKAMDEGVWHAGNMDIKFRDSREAWRVSADCSGEGGTLHCGVDCDGGGYAMTAISKSQLSVTPDDYLRYYNANGTDAADETDQADDAAPKVQTVGFKTGDKNLTLDRTDIQDCLPLISDEGLKAGIIRGAVTQ